jgi:DNA-binding NarL/FixJ family response regulator
MARVKVALADDHQLVLDAVVTLLDIDGDFDVVAAASSGAQLLRTLAHTSADVVVLDVLMPGTDGLACLDAIRERHPDVKVVMLSGVDDPRVAQRTLRHGAAAFVKKGVDPRDLAAVLRQVLEQTVVSPSAVCEADESTLELRSLLTSSELAVLEALARGLVNKQIAHELDIAPQTVKFHLTNVYRKLGVRNRTEAMRCAFESRLVERDVVAL